MRRRVLIIKHFAYASGYGAIRLSMKILPGEREPIMKFTEKNLRLYAVTDRSWLRGESLYSQVEKALKGGATMIQIREKEMEEEEFLKEALEIQQLCRTYQVPLIINDNVKLAARIHADGVHVGQKDMEVREARKQLGAQAIIGVSAHTLEEAAAAREGSADYLGVGAVFPTGTKSDTTELGIEGLSAICRQAEIPVVAIGGITKEKIALLKGSGASGIAAVSAIFAQEDIEKAAGELLAEVNRTLGETEP